MSVIRFRLAASLVAVGLVAGCGPVHDEQLGGPWRLSATDDLDGMMLCRQLDEDDGCYGDMLHGPTVFAAGIDARYVVYARHPRTFPDPPLRAVTEFYYVVRTTDDDDAPGLRADNIKGPFDKAAFEEERRRLDLPPFSRVFEDLK